MAKLTYKEVIPREKHREYPTGVFDKLFGTSFMRKQFAKWSGHGVVPVVLGIFLIIEGPKAIRYRSLVVVLCAAWLAIDIGIAISKRKWSTQVKGVWWSSLTCLSFCAAMGFMYLFLGTELQKQQDETFDGLEAKIELPPSKINLNSTFTFTNNSHNEIGAHTLFCRMVAGESPHSVIENAHEYYNSESNQPIEPGNDGETRSCINGPEFTFLTTPDSFLTCMDVIVGIKYSLTSQPNIATVKQLRFISESSSGYEWRQERLKTEKSPCGYFRFKHPRP